jgi:hypothetical protein
MVVILAARLAKRSPGMKFTSFAVERVGPLKDTSTWNGITSHQLSHLTQRHFTLSAITSSPSRWVGEVQLSLLLMFPNDSSRLGSFLDLYDELFVHGLTSLQP